MLKQPTHSSSVLPATNRDRILPALRIDAHHHIWRYNQQEYPWLQGELACLQRDYGAQDLLREMESAGVAGAVAVQARQTEAETVALLQMAALHMEILGVVGWLPLTASDLPARLEQFTGTGWLKGLRHVVQAEPDGFLAGADFERGVRKLADTALVFDLLILERQMMEAIAFVDRHPRQSFVLDHLAKPCIGARQMEPWASNLKELARRSNVTCKLSGMVTEAGTGWSATDLEPYFDVALEAFTPRRLMVGSDWPVLTAHCTYVNWWQTVADWLEPLSQDEQADMLGDTARRVYNLQVPQGYAKAGT